MTESKDLIALWSGDRQTMLNALQCYAEEMRLAARRRSVAGPDYRNTRKIYRAERTAALRLVEQLSFK